MDSKGAHELDTKKCYTMIFYPQNLNEIDLKYGNLEMLIGLKNTLGWFQTS